ncbi:hypothetical protein CS8_055000 [Cupriavidus sp. 8B]
MRRRVGGVKVCADGIDGKPVLLAIADELVNPGILRGRGAADLQAIVDALDRVDCGAIEREIALLVAGPELSQIGFVPDFEQPLGDFGDAIARDPMAYQFMDQQAPLPIIRWRGYVGTIVKYGSRARRQRRRHE